MSQQEKDKWRAFAKDMDKKYAALLTERTQSCKTGDAKACKELACSSLDGRRGPAEDFIYCAKARGLPHGSYWVITEGHPDPDPQSDKHLLEAALTPRLKEGRHETLHKMDLLCFRKNRTRTDFVSDQYWIDQILYVEKGANGPLLRLTFSQNGYGAHGTKTMPEYKTLEELIDKTCEK
ncbi:hypothetical protein ACO0LM_21905 [Undibacterium sp. Di26W]|uniref:hypothetical protein n=1 Tax=Undibacterium sp. Di26W TaxID=3413035 RepID=UPI003BF03C21